MWGTLVIQLPSVYAGAALRVYSPSAPHDTTTFDFADAAAAAPTSTPAASRKSARLKKQAEKAAAAACAASRRLKFAAFYADCQHEVDTLTGGLRCVLVYNLTGVDVVGREVKTQSDQRLAHHAVWLDASEAESRQHWSDTQTHRQDSQLVRLPHTPSERTALRHLTGVPLEKTLAKKRGLSESEWRGAPSKLCASPPQPADEALVAKIAHALRALTRETDAHYPDETYTEEVNSYSRGKAPPVLVARPWWVADLWDPSCSLLLGARVLAQEPLGGRASRLRLLFLVYRVVRRQPEACQGGL